VTQLVPPRTLPRLDFEQGIPADWPTAVVVPAMLSGAEEVQRLARNLELNYLGNADPELRFALLTDFPDAAAERDACDEEWLVLAVAAIDELNARYGDGARRPFALFHRRRQWNESEGCWMGWERKRGKLAEFNRLLLGDPHTSFERCHADVAAFRRVRLVITLDADTRMPAGVATSLAGILAHPLNRPVIDPSTGRVSRGYTAVQPRSRPIRRAWRKRLSRACLPGMSRSTPMCTPYPTCTRTCSAPGSSPARAPTTSPPSTPASTAASPRTRCCHTTCWKARTAGSAMLRRHVARGLPGSLAAMVRRMHRWVRGDWQLLPWLFPARRGERSSWRGSARSTAGS